MSANDEIVFNSIEELFNHIVSRGGAESPTYGQTSNFYRTMQVYTNPNTCSCKKTRAARNNIISLARHLNALSGEALVNTRALFDNRVVILREANQEILRF
jgi:hypothetical protein